MAEKKTSAGGTKVKVRDLAPRKTVKGGNGCMPSANPLPIPPPGFVVSSETKTNQER